METQDRELLRDVSAILQDHHETLEKEFDAKLAAFRTEIKQAGARGFGGFAASSVPADSIGALVTKDARFAALQQAGRGIAQVSVNRRLVEAKSTIIMDSTVKPGVQSLPVVQLPGPAFGVADLIPQRTLIEGSLMFVRQKGPHPVAGVQVAQGDVKAEADFVFETVIQTPATLAIWVPASRQALRDVSGLVLVINSELMNAVKVLEEQEILNGDGSAGHLHGIVPQATALAATTGDTMLDAVARAIGSLAAAGVTATGVVMNPADWLNVMLLKDGNQNYLLGSPAAATATLLWGLRRALSTAMSSGRFLVGNFVLGSELGFVEQAVVDVSTEHADFFVRNLICVRAEESVALAVKQPTCFVKSSFASPGTAASHVPPHRKG